MILDVIEASFPSPVSLIDSSKEGHIPHREQASLNLGPALAFPPAVLKLREHDGGHLI